MYAPVPRTVLVQPKLYTYIIDNIKKLIQDGTLKIGDVLPSERFLAEQFEVSRVPIREALKTLEYIGVIQSVPGKGMVIQGLSVADLIESINFTLLTPNESISDLYEAREATEVKAARLAAGRRTREDLDRIQKSIQAMETEVRAGRYSTKPSLDFHTAVVIASRNKILYQIHRALFEVLELACNESLRHDQRREVALQGHKEIYQMILEQNRDGAADAMFQHLQHPNLFVEPAENTPDIATET